MPWWKILLIMGGAIAGIVFIVAVIYGWLVITAMKNMH